MSYIHDRFWTDIHVSISFVQCTITKLWLKHIVSSSQASIWFCYTHGKFSYWTFETIIKWNILLSYYSKTLNIFYQSSHRFGCLRRFLNASYLIYVLLFCRRNSSVVSKVVFQQMFSRNHFPHQQRKVCVSPHHDVLSFQLWLPSADHWPKNHQ